jgi:hypothetical protein
MYKVTEVLLRVYSEHEYEEGDVDSCTLKTEQIDLSQLLRETDSYTLFQMGFITIDPKKGLSKEAIAHLKQHGWVHASTIKSQNERKELEQKFWLMDRKGDGYPWYKPAFVEIDLNDVSDGQIQQLASGAEIVQKVSPKSVLHNKVYQQVQTTKKAKEAAANKRKETDKKRAEKKKLKEIEQAKKVLKEAGELT